MLVHMFTADGNDASDVIDHKSLADYFSNGRKDDYAVSEYNRNTFPYFNDTSQTNTNNADHISSSMPQNISRNGMDG